MKPKPRKPGFVVEEFDIKGKDGKKHHVVFRYPKMSDVDDLLKYINSLVDEKAYIGKQKKATKKEETAFLKRITKEMKDGKSIHVCVVVGGKVAGLGRIGRKPMDANRHVGTVGIGLAKKYRGLKIGKRLMEELLRQGRGALGLRIVESSYYDGNKASENLHKSTGFRRAGRIPEGCNYYGKYIDEIIAVKKL